MKTISVKVTQAQEKYINALSGQLAGIQPGDLLLALAFGSFHLDDKSSSDDSRVEQIVAAATAFVRNRRIPGLVPEELFKYGVCSRAPLATTSRREVDALADQSQAGRN